MEKNRRAFLSLTDQSVSQSISQSASRQASRQTSRQASHPPICPSLRAHSFIHKGALPWAEQPVPSNHKQPPPEKEWSATDGGGWRGGKGGESRIEDRRTNSLAAHTWSSIRKGA